MCFPDRCQNLYQIFADRCTEEVILRQLSGIDGICFLIDGELVTTINEAQDIFNRPKRNISVTIYLMQSKTSELFDKGEILKFGQGAVDLVTDHSEFLQSDFIIEKAWHVPCSVVIENTAVLDCLDCFFDLFRRQYQSETDISFS